jgi:peptidoglycan/xylan/chitin deacetylase (PgdA/CDA1 family)
VAELRKSYEIVSLDDALEMLTSEEPYKRSKPSAVLTFDDGDKGLYDHLLPFLTADALPVTIYIATRQIESGEPYWFDRIMNALQAPRPVKVELDQFGTWCFGTEEREARWDKLGRLLESLKTAAPKVREELTQTILSQASDTPKELAELRPMTVAQLREIAALKCVTIGAHSHCHNLLDQIPISEASESIMISRSKLETWIDSEVKHFAYPNGNEYMELRAILKQSGFTSGTAMDNKLAVAGSDPFALSRIGIGRYDTLWRFRLRLLGM